MQHQTTYASHGNRLRFLHTTAMALTLGTAAIASTNVAHADKAIILLRTPTPSGTNIREWALPLPTGDGMVLAESEGRRVFIGVRAETLTFELDVPKESIAAKLQTTLVALRAKPATVEVAGGYSVALSIRP